MRAQLAAFLDDRVPAGRLARQLGVSLRPVELHRFADGESLPLVPTGARRVVIYRSLHEPDAKLIPLLLAADAWRRSGADHLTLVAPYLCYLRQDKVFRAGEPLSRDVVAPLLGAAFDRIVTVDPHLHRTRNLSEVFGADVAVGGAGPCLAQAIGKPGDGWIVVGPDGESHPWAASIAEALHAPFLVLSKHRKGEHSVRLTDSGLAQVRGRRVVIADDICSGGATMEAAIPRLLAAGAATVDIAVTHALFDRNTERRLHAAGAGRILFTDSCRTSGAATPLAPLLAQFLEKDFSDEP